MTISSTQSNCHFYIENGRVQKENDSFLGSLGRFIKVKTSSKDYDILKILKSVIDGSSSELNKDDIDFICTKSAKKLKISEDSLKSFMRFTSLSTEEKINQVNDFSENLSGLGEIDQSKKCAEIKNLQKFANNSRLQNPQINELLERAYQKVKLKAIGLDPSLADKCLGDIKLLLDTRLIYAILGLQNTTQDGKQKHALNVRENADGTFDLMILKEGRFESVKELKKTLEFDKTEGMLRSKNNPDERWNYFNEGLIPVDRFYHHDKAELESYPKENAKLHAVTTLSHEEMQTLLAHAQTSLSDQNESKGSFNAVVQFITHPRIEKDTNPLFENLNAQVPVHCGIRVITSDGKVYSTGFGSTLDEDKFNAGINKYLATINGQPTNIDYEEFRSHNGRIVTSLPVTQDSAEEILAKLNEYRKEGIRFNILRQNCMRLGTTVLSMAGQDLDIRVSLDTTLRRALPDSKNIPVVGPLLSNCVKWVTNFADLIDKKTPEVVKGIFKAIGNIAFFIPRKIGTFFKNVLVYSFGGVVASPRLKKDLSNEEFIDGHLEDFKCLLSNIFDDEASDIYHSSVFVNWQLSQKTTQFHEYQGPSMNVVPLSYEKDQHDSNERIKDLKNIYKYSTPEKV